MRLQEGAMLMTDIDVILRLMFLKAFKSFL